MKRDWLKALRKGKRLTQTQVADKAGITSAGYSHIENGIVKPSVETSKALGIILDFDWVNMYGDNRWLELKSAIIDMEYTFDKEIKKSLSGPNVMNCIIAKGTLNKVIDIMNSMEEYK